MKKLLSVLFVVVFACSCAFAETKTLGEKTEILLSMFEGYLEPFGITTYPLKMTKQEKAQSSFVKPYTKYCSLYITQENGVVTSLKIVSSEDDGSSERIDEILACFMAGIMITNLSISADDAIDYLTRMAGNSETIVVDGISYRVISGQPFTSILSLEIVPQE